MSSITSSTRPANSSSPRPPLFIASPLANDDGSPKIQKVFIANRGEIACRVIATCRQLNLVTIVVYVQEDKSSRHIGEADEAINLGSIEGAASNPFLDMELLVKTAMEAGAHAVHPGYGYLSENPEFADRVREAGMLFLGPSSVAMSTLGNKRTSKEYLAKNAPDVPLIPGFAGTSQNLQDLEDAAKEIGFPIILKASAGGGGKGMRIVRDPSSLREELERAQSEAKRSFGSDDCILEKYIDAGKHVEVQIIGDSHGQVVSLWDRDCSVQRRHQKVIEEAPCPWLSNAMRKRMSETATQIAELIGYEGAGTVEFVVDVIAGKYYFLEVNARLQVEHPITEEITGLDLVSLQLYVATGGRLADLEPLRVVAMDGHAIECRLCAEDAHRDFFPEHGQIRAWQPAPGTLGPGRNARYETAIRTGSQVSIHFDSMIAKLIVWAPTRDQAIKKMIKMLANTVCIGVRTNQLFLQSCLSHIEFSNPAYTTSFIGKHIERLLQNPHHTNPATLYDTFGAIASLYLRWKRRNSRSAFRNARLGFRNQRFDPINRSADLVISVSEGVAEEEAQKTVSLILADPIGDDARLYDVSISRVPQTTLAEKDKQTTARVATARYNVISTTIRTGAGKKAQHHRTLLETVNKLSESQNRQSDVVTASIDGKKATAIFSTDSHRSDKRLGASVYAHIPALGTWTEYRVYSSLEYAESIRQSSAVSAEGSFQVVKAPMPCKVLRMVKKTGDAVAKGDSLMVVESMKMEISINAPNDGTLSTVCVEGDAVDEGVVLCEVR